MSLGKALLGVGSLLTLFSGYKIISNTSTYLDVDKKIEKKIGSSGGTVVTGKKEGILSMEELLEEAYNNSKQWEGVNSALVFKSEMYNMENMQEILKAAIQHAHEIGMLDDAYTSGELPEDAPEWVKITYENCKPDWRMSLKEKRLLSSEFAGVIGTVYEAFNDAVSGGVQAKGNVSQTNMALIDSMEKAANWSYGSPIDVDVTPINNAWAYTYFSLIYSDMGKLEKAVENLELADEILSEYPDDLDLTIARSDIDTMNIGRLRKSINSAIYAFRVLDGMNPEMKYTQGWWEQVKKKSESLGSSNVFIGDMADKFGGRYGQAALIWILPLVLGAGLTVGGYLSNKEDAWKKRLRGRS